MKSKKTTGEKKTKKTILTCDPDISGRGAMPIQGTNPATLDTDAPLIDELLGRKLLKENPCQCKNCWPFLEFSWQLVRRVRVSRDGNGNMVYRTQWVVEYEFTRECGYVV